MKQGPLEEALIRRAHTDRRPIPEAIANAPLLLPGLAFYLKAFIDLGSCRPVGFGEGRIPWTAVFDYASRLELSSDDFEDLWQLISLMDIEYLKYQQAKADQKRKAEEAAGKRGT